MLTPIILAEIPEPVSAQAVAEDRFASECERHPAPRSLFPRPARIHGVA